MTDPTPDPGLQALPDEADATMPDTTIEILDPSPALRELVEIAQQLTEDEQKRLLQTARMLLDRDL